MEEQLNRGDIVHYGVDNTDDFCYILVTNQSAKERTQFSGVVLHGDGGTHITGAHLLNWNKECFEYLSEDLTMTITAPPELADKAQEDNMKKLLDALDDKLHPGVVRTASKPKQNEKKKSTVPVVLPDFSDFSSLDVEDPEEATPDRTMSCSEFDV